MSDLVALSCAFSTATVYGVRYRPKNQPYHMGGLKKGSKTGQERSLFARSLWKCCSWFSCVTLVSKVRLVFRPRHEPSVTSNVLNLQPYKRTDTHTHTLLWPLICMTKAWLII